MYAPPDVAGARAAALTWARALHAAPAADWVIFGAATTGLGRFAELVAVAVLAPVGTVLLDTLVRPVAHIPDAATALHGITALAVAGAPSFAEVYPLLAALLHGRLILGWDSAFNQALITQSHRARGGLAPPIPGAVWQGLLFPYAALVGEWDAAHGHYAHPDLPGTDHTALGEARAVLALLTTLTAARPVEQEAR